MLEASQVLGVVDEILARSHDFFEKNVLTLHEEDLRNALEDGLPASGVSGLEELVEFWLSRCRWSSTCVAGATPRRPAAGSGEIVVRRTDSPALRRSGCFAEPRHVVQPQRFRCPLGFIAIGI